jgi:hypothetical protein
MKALVLESKDYFATVRDQFNAYANATYILLEQQGAIAQKVFRFVFQLPGVKA